MSELPVRASLEPESVPFRWMLMAWTVSSTTLRDADPTSRIPPGHRRDPEFRRSRVRSQALPASERGRVAEQVLVVVIFRGERQRGRPTQERQHREPRVEGDRAGSGEGVVPSDSIVPASSGAAAPAGFFANALDGTVRRSDPSVRRPSDDGVEGRTRLVISRDTRAVRVDEIHRRRAAVLQPGLQATDRRGRNLEVGERSAATAPSMRHKLRRVTSTRGGKRSHDRPLFRPGRQVLEENKRRQERRHKNSRFRVRTSFRSA